MKIKIERTVDVTVDVKEYIENLANNINSENFKGSILLDKTYANDFLQILTYMSNFIDDYEFCLKEFEKDIPNRYISHLKKCCEIAGIETEEGEAPFKLAIRIEKKLNELVEDQIF